MLRVSLLYKYVLHIKELQQQSSKCPNAIHVYTDLIIVFSMF